MSGIRIINEENGKIECLCGEKAYREERLYPGKIGLEVLPCIKCGGVTFKTVETVDNYNPNDPHGLLLTDKKNAWIS